MSDPAADPDELDPTAFSRPRADRRSGPTPSLADHGEESLLDVLGRVAETATQIESGALPPAPDPATAPAAPGTTETSASGEAEVTVRDHRLLDLRLDPGWLMDADPVEVERLVRDIVNRALAAELEHDVQQLMSGALGGRGLAGRIAELQTDAHRAFTHDLARVVAPAHETVHRMDGAR